jgi:hypothetical protein
MSGQVPIELAEEITTHCEMCRRVMVIRKLVNGEYRSLVTDRNVILSYSSRGVYTYVYVCDNCLDGGI